MELDADFDISTLPDLPITFEMQLPEEMNAEVVELFEIMHQEVEGFDEMLLHAVTSINNDQSYQYLAQLLLKQLISKHNIIKNLHQYRTQTIHQKDLKI